MKLICRCVVNGSQVHEYLELTDEDVTYIDVNKFEDLHTDLMAFLLDKYGMKKLFLLDIRLVPDDMLHWPDNPNRLIKKGTNESA